MGHIYQARLIETIEEFNSLKNCWNSLLSGSAADNIFLRWEWLWNWWAVYASDGDKLAIILIENNGVLVGIAPFYARTRRLGGMISIRTLMFLGTQTEGQGDVGSDYMDIIAAPNECGPVFETVFREIAERRLCDEIFLSKVDTSSTFFSHYTAGLPKQGFIFSISDQFLSPYIALPSSFDTYLGQLPSSMRQKIKKERKNLQEHYPEACVMTTVRPEQLDDNLQRLIALHQKRWQERGEAGVFADNKFMKFHRLVMPVLLRNGHLRLETLAQNDRIFAVLYNFAYNNKIYFYQSGIDTQYGNVAFGYILHAHCIEDAINMGLREYDFLPESSEKSYKHRFAKTNRAVVNLYTAYTDKAKCYMKLKGAFRPLYRALARPV